MDRCSLTTEQKRTLARDWLAARAHGERQEVFCAKAGISSRRLREFVAEFGPVGAPIEDAREIVSGAIQKLQLLLAHIDETARPPAPADAQPTADAREEAASPPQLIDALAATDAGDEAARPPALGNGQQATTSAAVDAARRAALDSAVNYGARQRRFDGAVQTDLSDHSDHDGRGAPPAQLGTAGVNSGAPVGAAGEVLVDCALPPASPPVVAPDRPKSLMELFAEIAAAEDE